MDPKAEEYYTLSPYNVNEANPIINTDPEGDCPKCLKTLVKAAVKSIAKGKIDLGEVYDIVDGVNTLLDPNASGWEKAEAAFNLVSPVSTTEAKAASKLLGVADDVKDGVKKVTDNTYNRVKPRKETLEQVSKNQPKNAKGEMIDPHTFKVLDPAKTDLGHKPGQEWKKRKADHQAKGSTREEVIKAENDPSLYHWEDRSSNRSHKHEKK